MSSKGLDTYHMEPMQIVENNSLMGTKEIRVKDQLQFLAGLINHDGRVEKIGRT